MYGYTKERYFPLSLSRAFLALCLFEEENITSEFCCRRPGSVFQRMKGRLLRNVLKERLIVMMMMCWIFSLITIAIELLLKKTFCR